MLIVHDYIPHACHLIANTLTCSTLLCCIRVYKHTSNLNFKFQIPLFVLVLQDTLLKLLFGSRWNDKSSPFRSATTSMSSGHGLGSTTYTSRPTDGSSSQPHCKKCWYGRSTCKVASFMARQAICIVRMIS